MYSFPRTIASRTFLGIGRTIQRPATQTWHRRHYAAAAAPQIRKIGWGPVTRPASIGMDDKYRLSSVDTSPNGVHLEVVGSKPMYFEHLALRDMCQCPMCVDSSTKQRNFAFADIPLDIQGDYHLRDDGKLEVHWMNDLPGFDSTHRSVFTARKLFEERDFSDRKLSHYNIFPTKLWTAKQLRDHRRVIEYSFHRFLRHEDERADAVENLLKWGLIFIRHVPLHGGPVREILERLGPLRNTFYGKTWDVRSVAGAKNVAYTSQDLGFHQDLLYMANPPGLQALHMIKASTTGGESLFTDGARAVDTLLEEHPEHRETLFSFPVTYRYRNAGEWYEYSRPTLEVDASQRPLSTSMDYHQQGGGYGATYDYINWSPPFQGPFAVDRGFERVPAAAEIRKGSDLKQYRKAAQALRTLFEAPEAVYEERMEPGTCVVFNNRRILHARKAFPVGGGGGGESEERWLRGAYGDLDSLMSRYRTLHSHEIDVPKLQDRTNAQAAAPSTPGSNAVETSELNRF